MRWLFVRSPPWGFVLVFGVGIVLWHVSSTLFIVLTIAGLGAVGYLRRRGFPFSIPVLLPRAWWLRNALGLVMLIAFAVTAITLSAQIGIGIMIAGFVAIEVANRVLPGRIALVPTREVIGDPWRRWIEYAVIAALVAACVHSWWPARVTHPPLDRAARALASRYARAFSDDDKVTQAQLFYMPFIGGQVTNSASRSVRMRRVGEDGTGVTYEFWRSVIPTCARDTMRFELGKVNGRWRVTGAKWLDGFTSSDPCK
jgi:hypothetical protein